MDLTAYTLFNLRRVATDRAGLFFSVLLPVLFYLIFGALQNYVTMPLRDGNIAADVMIGMAVFGGVTAACSQSGSAVVEQTSGWARQLALTPLGPSQMLLTQAVVILVRSCLPVLAVNIAGLFTQASMPWDQWLGAMALSVLVALPFGFYGVAVALLLRTESAISIASSSLVVLAFIGNTFSPLPEFLIPLARCTPLYGATSLARYPLTHGLQTISEAPYTLTDPLWYAIINVLAWTTVFAGACALLHGREKGRA